VRSACPRGPVRLLLVERDQRAAGVLVEVDEGLLDRLDDPRACGQVKGRVAAASRGDQRVEVTHVAANELGAGAVEVCGIADREIVVDAHVVAARPEGAHQRRADEAGAAGHERPGHGGEL